MIGKRVTIYVKNIDYGKSLARGLCYKSTGLEVFFADSLEMALEGTEKGILLTDYDVKDNPKIIKILREDKLQPLDILIAKIRVVFREIWQIEIDSNLKINTNVIGIYSKCGGNGVTSFAIALARMISIKTDKNVLFLSMDTIDDSFRYVNLGNYNKASKTEYFFMKEEGITISISDYLMRDQWGVNYFMSSKKQNFFDDIKVKNRILEFLKSEDYFEYIIVDFGKAPYIDGSQIDKKIEIMRKKSDQDLSKECVDSDLKVVNFSEHVLSDNNYFHINNVEDDFVEIDGIIDISMEGEYSKSLEEFVEYNKLIWMESDDFLQIMSE